MLQRSREYLTLALIALLPFHALMVTVGTFWILGRAAGPLATLAVWKELFLAVLCVLALLEILSRPTKNKWKTVLSVDLLDLLILGLIILGIVIGGFQGNLGSSGFIYGFRYDFVPLIAFLILRRVEWSSGFFADAKALLVLVGGIVAGYGIISFFLPQSFFSQLGYSDLHSLYLPDQPIAAFQKIGGTELRRIQSTMSGPNQLGLWLLIPWSIMLASKRDAQPARLRRLFFLALIAGAMALTFSRAAWIATAVVLVMWMWRSLPRSLFKKKALQLGIAFAAFLLLLVITKPELLLRAASSRDHILRPLQAIQRIAEAPFGSGLGSAGPASNRVSDACVHLELGADASWAADRRDLCVFVGDAQVQPLDRECSCPFLPENWYLQIGVELGLLGFVFFVLLMLFLIEKLSVLKKSEWVFLSFVGVSIAAVFLHAWEDAAVAYTLWLMCATVILHRH